VGVAANGAISFVSAAFVGSISDPQLTCCSGLLSELDGKGNVSVMVDCGFTVQGVSYKVLVLNRHIPPFLDGRDQLPEEVQQGRLIASLHIHVKCAIGRMKTILKGVLPINMVVLLIKLYLYVHG